MNKLAPILILLFPLSFSYIFAQPTEEPIRIGTRYLLESKILVEERPVLIALPEGYAEAKQSYPVIYLLDGGGNFHHTTATVNFLTRNDRMPPMIVVGIPNTGNRTRDLTPPTEATDDWPRAGGADNLLAFMEKELMPYVEETYRVHPYKVLIGHSFGGLFAIHALLNHPGMFNSYIAISPSLWWDEQRLVWEQSDSFFNTQQELTGHLYMTMGNEGGTMLGGAWKLAALLEEKSPKNFHWYFDHMPEETHGSIPMRSTYKGLEFIFEEWNLKKQEELLIAGGIDALETYEETLEELYGFDHKWEEATLLNFGQKLLEGGKPTTATPIMKRCTELYPDSDKAWFGLGESLAKGGRKPEAVRCLRQSVSLNPENIQALGTLSQLGEDISEFLPVVKLSTKELEGYSGAYKIREGMTLSIQSDGEKLWAEGPMLEKEALFPLGEHRFFVISKNSRINFKLQEARASSILVETPDGTFNGERLE